MKRIKGLAVIIVLALLALTLTACGKSQFGATETSEKRIVLTAEKADKDAFLTTGSLEVEDGEEIVVTPNLTDGSVKVELIAAPEEQSVDEIPEMDGVAAFIAEVSGTEGTSDTVSAGSYLLRATCVEKATGTVQVEVKPAA